VEGAGSLTETSSDSWSASVISKAEEVEVSSCNIVASIFVGV